LVRAVLAVPEREFVLDGEALGLDEDGNPLKFQDSMSADSHLRPFFFDVLHVAGRSLIDEPLSVRKAALAATVPSALALPTLDVRDAGQGAAAAEEFARAALAAGHEGVMVKALDSPYQAGRRGSAWRKVKPVHTLDLVVLAAEWGHGRRQGWLSNLHLGARGADGTFVMVGKTFKGLTDELLRWQTDALQQRALGQEGIVVHVRPELVVEIALDGVQRSTRYPSGVALRFARVRRYRPDKVAAEADTIERVQAML
jgi:DNA ligase-1